ncbi:glycerate kinase type-2 family protein [Halobaculum magnesiiphilum]|uniref:DUF4147 domain-containing protein n=1 Tax=Halobaculum magnesiiphilum TaxID=1017351 RepID=A0A8T8WHT4_9EURY|nr:DUF4147 domain-containing protein [Halobaculum magnesiiphilum]QZP39432.1 DUF4147 domain-containing protein [Halobaculum magnesiiphilum]
MANDERPTISVGSGSTDSTPSDAEGVAIACLRAGIEAALPETVVADAVSLDGDALRVGDATYDLGAYDRVVVVGGGKAADGAAAALESLLGDRIDAGTVVVDDTGSSAPGGNVDSARSEQVEQVERIERVVGGHPVPTSDGVEGTERAVELARSAGEETLVLAVITGGASALFASPVDSVGLSALCETTDAMLSAGADIDEINAVRKHLSRVKGGRFAAAAAPAMVVGVVLSDVVGDDLGVIGSGPIAPDDSTYAEALDVLDRYGIDAPTVVRDHLERGARGAEPETPTADATAFDRVDTHVIASAATALDAAATAAKKRGYDPLILSSRIRGEAREAGVTHAAIAEEIVDSGNPLDPPALVLSGGETTVTVEGDGTGGPNLECVLAAGIEFASPDSPVQGRSVAFLAADTDGRDGSTDAAGAVVTPQTIADAADAADARAALDDNDALPALSERNAVVTTGATGTNVNDLRVIVVGE